MLLRNINKFTKYQHGKKTLQFSSSFSFSKFDSSKPKIVLPPLYFDVNRNKPLEYHDYENYEISWGNQDDYELMRKIGQGKYSIVYDGLDIVNGRGVVLKLLKPVKKAKIKREIKILENLKDGPNIIKLLDVVRDPECRAPTLVFEKFPSLNFKVCMPEFTLDDIKLYMYEILRSLEFSHSCGIFHRDIKPQNIILHTDRKSLRIIDWGLAEFYHPEKNYNVRVASRYYKPPELMLSYNYYDYSLDIWSLGTLFAAMIFKMEPFFKGTDNNDQLIKIAKVMGTEELHEYVREYNISLDQYFKDNLTRHSKKPWERFINNNNSHLCTPEAIDLLNRMLVYNHAKRITPKDALQHIFFNIIKRRNQKESLK